MDPRSPRILAPGRLSWAVAVVALLAAAAAQMHLPTPVRAPLGYLLLGVIPGWLLAESLLRSAGTTAEEVAMASLVLSVPVTIAGRTLAFAAGLPAPAFLWAWAGLCAGWALLLRPRTRGGPPADAVAWLIAGALALLVALPAALNPAVRDNGDAMLHAQIVNEIRLRGIPPQDPSCAGMPLNYIWQFHVWGAALVEGMGLPPLEVFPWVGGAMMAALALGVFRVASVFWTENSHRRLAPAVVALGMNALGWVLIFTHLLIAPLIGEHRGFADFYQRLWVWVLHPNANQVCGGLILDSYFVLCSFLNKYLTANSLGTALTLIIATFVLVAVHLREGGRGRLVAIAAVAMSAALAHPVVGVPAGLAVLAGLGLATFAADGRGRAVAAALAVTAGLGLAAPVMWYMLHLGLTHGSHRWLHFNAANLPPLVQGLSVVMLPALWGWGAVLRRSKALALFGLGFAIACLAFALVLSPPVPLTEGYLVYLGYLGVALFAAAGVGMLVSAVARRRGRAPAWGLAALVFLPSALLLFNGYARQSRDTGHTGYPETPDEIAVFDYVRDHTPIDAIVIDLQHAYSSSVAAYSGRRGLFGGSDKASAAVMGYPPGLLIARERAVVNLLLEPGINDSTWKVLRAVRAPLFVVARHTHPYNPIARPNPDPRFDAIAKLDGSPAEFAVVLRTPAVVLYRIRSEFSTARGAGSRSIRP